MQAEYYHFNQVKKMNKKKTFIIIVLVILFLTFILTYLIEPVSSIDINETTTITGQIVKLFFFLNFF